MFGKADAKLPEQGFLFRRWFGDAAQADLATVGGGKNDVGALESGKQGDCSHRRQRLSVVDSARRRLRNHYGPALQQMFERDPQSIAQESHHQVSLHARLQLVEQRPNRKFALQCPERRFSFGQLHVLRPQFFGLSPP